MKKLLFIIIPAALMAGCEKEIAITPPEIEGEVTSEIPLRNVENAVYNELTDSWMIPQNDPFTLENFQKAYDNLASGNSLQTLTRAETEELFEPGVKLEPTHYALRIYPRTEEEQWRVEMMDDVSVVYAPFNYSKLTEEEIERVPQTRSEISSPFEVSPYTVTCDYTEPIDGDPIGLVTYQLPILYVVWPVEKPLPEDLEYVVDYEIFQPHEAPQTRSAEAMSTLVNEAFALASGDPAGYFDAIKTYVNANEDIPSTRADGTVLRWQVLAYDYVLRKDVPMANLKVVYQHSSYIIESVTDVDGFCKIPLPIPLKVPTLMYMEATVTYTYQDPKGRWKIVPYRYTDDYNTTIPYSIAIHNWEYYDDNLFYLTNPTVVLSDSGHGETTFHRAVNYFYNNQTAFAKPAKPIRISALCGEPGESKAYYGEGIFMYRTDMATTFHELSHLSPRPVLATSYSPHLMEFFIESFACFGGWYLGKEYYKTLGWTEPPGYSGDIAGWLGGVGQRWEKNSYNPYTSFFADLNDDYNQSTAYANTPNDQVKGVPASVIYDLYRYSGDWTQLKSNLQKYVGTGSGKYFTQAQLNTLIADFDYWFEVNKDIR